MEDDFFLKKMRGVKPFKKEEKRSNNKNKITKPKTTKKIEKKPIFVEIPKNKTSINSKFNVSFGDINRDLKRGKIKIDRRLDLHGYSLLDAYEVFKKEIKKTYNNNKRCILIITGKGAHIKKNNDNLKPKLFHGKIKNSIISWINEEELQKYIYTYQDAGFEHGGDGAIFVYLRKRKT